MANGDIPVTGSAVKGSGSAATFRIEAHNGIPDTLDHLRIRTQGKDLQITVFTGNETFGPKDLVKDKWTLTIDERP
jgi:hypothetical protein